jgi:hypothetical protein
MCLAQPLRYYILMTAKTEIIRPSNLLRRERCPGSLLAEANVKTPEPPEDENSLGGRGRRIHKAVACGILSPKGRTKLLIDFNNSDDQDVLNSCWGEAELCWKSLTDEQRERAVVLVEKPVDLSFIPGMDEGTPDFAIIVSATDDEDGFIVLRDWKTGAGWTPYARWNLQLLSYAVGLMCQHNIDGHANIGIFQPLVRPVADTWTATRLELDTVQARIERVSANCSRENAPLIPGGHCTYCKAAETCPARSRAVAEIKQIVDPIAAINALEGQARRDFYEKLKGTATAIERAVKSVNGAMYSGKLTVPGYEVGDGKKTRLWKESDHDTIASLTAKAISQGQPPYIVSKPISPAEAEKLLGKDTVKDMVFEKVGKPMIKRVKEK